MKEISKVAQIYQNISNPLQVLIYYSFLCPTEHPVFFELWNLQDLSWLMVRKVELHRYFKTHGIRRVAYIIPIHYLELAVFTILTYCHCICHGNPLPFTYKRCVGVGMKWKQRVKEPIKGTESRGRVILKFWRILMFSSQQLNYTLILFFSSIFSLSTNPNNNVKTKNYKDF